MRSSRAAGKESTVYRNYIFDFYGTLADIRTDEEKPYLWEKMSEIYGAMGAVYTPEELRQTFRRLERQEAERAFRGPGRQETEQMFCGSDRQEAAQALRRKVRTQQ